MDVPDEVNHVTGFAFGLVAALLSAALWALITLATNYQIGFMAMGVGFLVGYAVRLGGAPAQGMFSGERHFSLGFIGAGLAVFGCLLGNVLSGCWFVAQEQETTYMSVVTSLDFTLASEILGVMFSPVDIVFYGLAIWEGFLFAVGTKSQLEQTSM